MTTPLPPTTFERIARIGVDLVAVADRYPNQIGLLLVAIETLIQVVRRQIGTVPPDHA